jgi:putative transposase
MIYTTNWIERLQRDFRRVLRMRGAMPTEESVIVLMAKTAMGKKAYFRALPGIERDKVLFPDDSGKFFWIYLTILEIVFVIQIIE